MVVSEVIIIRLWKMKKHHLHLLHLLRMMQRPAARVASSVEVLPAGGVSVSVGGSVVIRVRRRPLPLVVLVVTM